MTELRGQPEHSVCAAGSGRERVLAAIANDPQRGVSWDLGYGLASFTRTAHERLCDYLGIDLGQQVYWSRMLQTVYPAKEIESTVCGDMRMVTVRIPIPVSLDRTPQTGEEEYTDDWGITRRLSSNGLYYDITRSPLEECRTPKECGDAFISPPIPTDRLNGLVDQVKDYGARGLAVGASCFAGIFEMVFWLRGYKNAFLDFARAPAIVETVMDSLLEVQVRFWSALLDKFGAWLDIALLTEDLGTQTSLLISPRQFRTLVKPRLKHLIDVIKARRPDTRVMLHSCGAIYPLIGDFIDIGVDILNPIQPAAANMDPERLKREFGADLCFHGGIDVQRILCHGTPNQVVEHVERCVEVLGAGGGYIAAPSHCIQPDVPPENVLAMVERLTQYAYSTAQKEVDAPTHGSGIGGAEF
jgi:uroporphyrinogen decarboxylase